MIGSEPVLVVAIVDGNLDRHGRVNKPNDSGWDSDIVGVSAVRSASEPIDQGSITCSYRYKAKDMYGPECLEVILAGGSFYPATSVTNPPPMTSTGSLIISQSQSCMKSICTLTFLKTPNLFIESTMLKNVSMDLAFSPIMVLWMSRSIL